MKQVASSGRPSGCAGAPAARGGQQHHLLHTAHELDALAPITEEARRRDRAPELRHQLAQAMAVMTVSTGFRRGKRSRAWRCRARSRDAARVARRAAQAGRAPSLLFSGIDFMRRSYLATAIGGLVPAARRARRRGRGGARLRAGCSRTPDLARALPRRPGGLSARDARLTRPLPHIRKNGFSLPGEPRLSLGRRTTALPEPRALRSIHTSPAGEAQVGGFTAGTVGSGRPTCSGARLSTFSLGST